MVQKTLARLISQVTADFDLQAKGSQRKVSAAVVMEYCETVRKLVENADAVSDPLPRLELSRLSVLGPLRLKGVYPGVNLRGTRFDDSIELVDASFLGEVDCVDLEQSGGNGGLVVRNTTFHHNTDFTSVKVSNGSFENAKFEGLGQFTKGQLLSLTNCDFNGDAGFDSANLINISDCRFRGRTSFHSLRAPNPFSIVGTRFEMETTWTSVPFGATVFRDVVFVGNVDFSKSRFGGLTEFENVEFRGDCVFNECVFEQSTRFGGTEFWRAPTFFGESAKLYPDFIFRKTKFLGFSEERDVAAYRRLRELAHRDLKSELEEARFFAFEQRALANVELKHNKASFGAYLSKLYDAVSEYGQNVTRPFVLFLTSNLMFGFLYWWYGCVLQGIKVDKGFGGWTTNIWPWLGFLLSNVVNPLAQFGKQSPFSAETVALFFLGLLQSVTSLLFLTLGFLAIRRRLRKGNE